MWRMERGTRSCYEGEVGGRMFYNAAAPKGARTEGRSYAWEKLCFEEDYIYNGGSAKAFQIVRKRGFVLRSSPPYLAAKV